jgi:CheY-like chemotaxis protein
LNELRDFHLRDLELEGGGIGVTKDQKMSKISLLFEECLGLIDDLDENSSVAVMTLNDLINYDKIETNTFTIEEKDVNIWSVIEKTVGPLMLQAKEKNIKLAFATRVVEDEVSLDLNNLRVVGDSIKLGQVIRNLVSNALKFTPAHGEVKITGTSFPFLNCLIFFIASYQPTEIPVTTPRQRVSSYLESSGETAIGKVIITVTDSGPGLSPEQQQALFHQGVQFNPNQLQAGQGSGLGLWISKEIVSLHHGTILVTSEGLGCGSTFQVTLPVVLREDLPLYRGSMTVFTRLIQPMPEDQKKGDSLFPFQDDENHQSLTMEIEGRRSSLLSPVAQSLSNPDTEPTTRHVLVVDDAASNRKLVCRLLRSKGFICHEAENGAECVEKVQSREYPYDFILLDYEMPIMNGPSAARHLRESGCNLLIIGVTGNVLPEDKAYFLDHGANVVLTKPLSISDLLEEITRHESSPLSHV